MTIQEFIDTIEDDPSYWSETEIYINGAPVDDISFGVLPGNGQLIVNLESYGRD